MRKRVLSLVFGGFWMCVHVGNLFGKRVHKIAFWVHVPKTCSQSRILGTCLRNVTSYQPLLGVPGMRIRGAPNG